MFKTKTQTNQPKKLKKEATGNTKNQKTNHKIVDITLT